MVTKPMCAGTAEQKGTTKHPAQPCSGSLDSPAWSNSPHLSSPADMEQAQRNLDAEQMQQQQQMKLRDRQKFFEEVFQHDVDFFFPMSHLQIEHRRRTCCGHQQGLGGVSGDRTQDWRSVGQPQSKDMHVLNQDGTTLPVCGYAVDYSHPLTEGTWVPRLVPCRVWFWADCILGQGQGL